MKKENIIAMIEREFTELNDTNIEQSIRELLIDPSTELREWDYGKNEEWHQCWKVLTHPESNTGIYYCTEGFGPTCPWGLMHLKGTDHMSIGTDCAWYKTFLEAFFESCAVNNLKK